MPLNPTEMAKIAFFEKMADFYLELRSHERLTLQTWFIAHFNQNRGFPIGVSYNLCPQNEQKWLKQAFI